MTTRLVENSGEDLESQIMKSRKVRDFLKQFSETVWGRVIKAAVIMGIQQIQLEKSDSYKLTVTEIEDTVVQNEEKLKRCQQKKVVEVKPASQPQRRGRGSQKQSQLQMEPKRATPTAGFFTQAAVATKLVKEVQEKPKSVDRVMFRSIRGRVPQQQRAKSLNPLIYPDWWGDGGIHTEEIRTRKNPGFDCDDQNHGTFKIAAEKIKPIPLAMFDDSALSLEEALLQAKVAADKLDVEFNKIVPTPHENHMSMSSTGEPVTIDIRCRESEKYLQKVQKGKENKSKMGNQVIVMQHSPPRQKSRNEEKTLKRTSTAPKTLSTFASVKSLRPTTTKENYRKDFCKQNNFMTTECQTRPPAAFKHVPSKIKAQLDRDRSEQALVKATSAAQEQESFFVDIFVPQNLKQKEDKQKKALNLKKKERQLERQREEQLRREEQYKEEQYQQEQYQQEQNQQEQYQRMKFSQDQRHSQDHQHRLHMMQQQYGQVQDPQIILQTQQSQRKSSRQVSEAKQLDTSPSMGQKHSLIQLSSPINQTTTTNTNQQEVPYLESNQHHIISQQVHTHQKLQQQPHHGHSNTNMPSQYMRHQVFSADNSNSVVNYKGTTVAPTNQPSTQPGHKTDNFSLYTGAQNNQEVPHLFSQTTGQQQPQRQEEVYYGEEDDDEDGTMDNYYEADMNSASQASHFYDQNKPEPQQQEEIDETYGGSTSSLQDSKQEAYQNQPPVYQQESQQPHMHHQGDHIMTFKSQNQTQNSDQQQQLYQQRATNQTLAQMTNPFQTKNEIKPNQSAVDANFTREEQMEFEENKQHMGSQNQLQMSNGDPSSSSMSGYDFKNMFNRVQQYQHQHNHASVENQKVYANISAPKVLHTQQSDQRATDVQTTSDDFDDDSSELSQSGLMTQQQLEVQNVYKEVSLSSSMQQQQNGNAPMNMHLTSVSTSSDGGVTPITGPHDLLQSSCSSSPSSKTSRTTDDEDKLRHLARNTAQARQAHLELLQQNSASQAQLSQASSRGQTSSKSSKMQRNMMMPMQPSAKKYTFAQPKYSAQYINMTNDNQ